MQRAASHQATGDLGGLMACSRRRGMGGKVARGSDEDRRCLLVTLPGEVLSHGGLQILHHVEAGVLAQERVAKERNEIGGRMASGNVVCRQPRGFRDLLLAVAGIEEPAAKLGRRQGCRVIAARQARGRDVEIAIEIDSERAMYDARRRRRRLRAPHR